MKHLYFSPQDRIWGCAQRAESSLRLADFLASFSYQPFWRVSRARWHRRRAARYSKLAFALSVRHYGQEGQGT